MALIIPFTVFFIGAVLASAYSVVTLTDEEGPFPWKLAALAALLWTLVIVCATYLTKGY